MKKNCQDLVVINILLEIKSFKLPDNWLFISGPQYEILPNVFDN